MLRPRLGDHGPDPQEKAIGRRKLSNVELEVKPPDSHVALTTIEDPDGTERKIDRSLPSAQLEPAFQPADGRLRVLMVIARPAALEDVGFQMIARPLIQRLAAVRGKVELVVLRPPTLERLAEVLTQAAASGKPFQIVHFDGHGVLTSARSSGPGLNPLKYAAEGGAGS